MSDTKQPASKGRFGLFSLILAMTAGGVLYRILVRHQLEQTSALFIGIPAMLAMLLALTPSPKSATGGIMKGLTLALLLSGPLLGEGFICILMASPLFYCVGLLVGAIIDISRKKSSAARSSLLLVAIPMCIEGTSPELSFDRAETVRASAVVDGSVEDVQQSLRRSPRTDLPLPLYLRLGFPRPTKAWGSGLEPGATRTIHFAGGEGHPGDLILKVEDARSGYARFVAVSDESKIAHWLDWRSSEIEWAALDASHTKLTWSIHFERRLDPAWYFGPWERYATQLAAEYLIRANATPAREHHE
jgi:hypothetical protein